MEIEEFKIGTRVRHNKFGDGTVVEVDNEGSAVTVDFDTPYENKKTRVLINSVLSIIEKSVKVSSKTNEDKSQIKPGARVEHKTFGMGTIVSIEEGHEYAVVDFDKSTDGKQRRLISFSFLKIYVPKVTNESTEIVKGDIVFSEQYGEGIVLERRGFFKSLVKFKNTGKEEVILNVHLTKVIEDIISEDELSDEEINSAFKIIPSNYSEQSCYSTNAKRLMTFFRRKYTNAGIATIKSYPEGDGEIGVLIVPEKGIIVFKMMNQEFPEDAIYSPMFAALAETQLTSIRNHYLTNFLMSKSLCVFKNNSYKVLKYPTRFVLIYPNIDISKITQVDKSRISVSNKNIFFKNFTSHIIDNELFSNFEEYEQNSFVEISQKMFGSIIERVVPENATLIDIAPKVEVTVKNNEYNPKFTPITGQEREFSALCLDDYQIKIINDTKPGHYLTLANPGTGKSVLLVSKAYRIQSIKNNNNVLITCYNKNLAEHHLTFSQVSGMKTPNLHISTFHKLVRDILSKKDPTFVRGLNIDESEKDFDRMIERFEQLLDAKVIETNLNAIFIDEIQLFDPKWIDICYKLLDKSNNKDYFFEMFGDINQDVKSQRSKGKASWQNTKVVPSLQGRVKKLEKNYRNTDLIAKYLTSMIEDFNKELTRLGVPVDPESSCITSETSKRGSLRTKILITANDKFSKVKKIVKELHDKAHAEYSEIAIIYPATRFSKWYFPINAIENELDNANIPFSFIHGDAMDGREKRYALFDCDGVVMSTIDSCLGLDFKYVILCGMHFWDYMFDERENKTRKLTSEFISKNPDAKFYVNEIGKKIYSACSRARDGLYIIDDLDKDSPIKKIIRPASGRRYFDEN